MLELAKEVLLKDYRNTFVVASDNNIVYISQDKGILPILNIVKNRRDLLKGAFVADRITGKAASLLYVYGEVNGAYSELLSQSGEKILREHNIAYQYNILCKNIKNREKNDLCPIEKISLQTEDPEELIHLIDDFLKGESK